MSIQSTSLFYAFVFGCLIIGAPVAAGADQVPIPGFNGTLALPSSVDTFYANLNKLIVKTGEGLRTKDGDTTKARGGARATETLQPGMTVGVHYTVKGIQASADETAGAGQQGIGYNQATVTSVDRDRKRITVAFPNGAVETLSLTQHAVDDPVQRTRSRVIVSYSDGSGASVADYFKPAH